MSKSQDEYEGMYSEGLLHSEADVPDGYVAIGDLHDANKPLHSFVLRACDKGCVRRYRVRQGQRGYGKFFVHKDDLSRVTKEWESLPQNTPERECQPRVSDARIEGAVIALCEINNGISLMLVTLERLASAVESIANQRDVSDRLRSEIMATCSERDGFHN